MWDNNGNPKNVIFTPTNHFQYSGMTTDPIYQSTLILSSFIAYIHDLIKLIVNAIDNNMTSIDPTTHAGNFENFKNKVAGVLLAIVHSGEAACGVTKPTRDFIAIHSGYPYLFFFLSFFLIFTLLHSCSLCSSSPFFVFDEY